MTSTTQTTSTTHPGPLAVGTKVPDFTLKLATKDAIADFTLSQHLGHGPVVFAFFPLAFTGVCTTEMCDFRDNLASLGALKATVYGFSVDTAPSNKAFAASQELPFGILSDPNREVVTKIWGLMPTALAGVNATAKRGVLVLNADGTVKWSSMSDDPKVWVGVAEVRKHL